MMIGFFRVCTGTPADCGEQSKQRTLSPVSEQTHRDVDNCMLEHVETFEKKSQDDVKFCIDSALPSLFTLGRCIHIHTFKWCLLNMATRAGCVFYFIFIVSPYRTQTSCTPTTNCDLIFYMFFFFNCTPKKQHCSQYTVCRCSTVPLCGCWWMNLNKKGCSALLSCACVIKMMSWDHVMEPGSF